MRLEGVDGVGDEVQQQLSSAVRKSKRILTTLHSFVALEERFNLMCNVSRLVQCELIYSNITAIVDCILCGIAFVEDQSSAFC